MSVLPPIYFALHYGLPMLILVLAVIIASAIAAKQVRLMVFSMGVAAAFSYYMWFETRVVFDMLPIYVAESCEAGGAVYHLPFGESAKVVFDAQPEDPNPTWIAIDNQSDTALVVDLLIYTVSGLAPEGSERLYGGYVIPAGEIHGLTIAPSNVYFLTSAPDSISTGTSSFSSEFWRYEVKCASPET